MGKKRKSVVYAAFGCLLLFSSGCGDRQAAARTGVAERIQDYPDWLAPFQGCWTSTNPDAVLQVDGDLFRLRCEAGRKSELMRWNARATAVDKTKGKIKFQGTKHPLYYEMDAASANLSIRLPDEMSLYTKEFVFQRGAASRLTSR